MGLNNIVNKYNKMTKCIVNKSSRPWWSKKWGADKICGITHTRLRPGKNKKGIYRTTRLSCKHAFCTYPLLKWIKICPSSVPTCPVCRRPFGLEELIRL